MDPMYSSFETQGSSASKASTDSKKCNWLMYLLLGIVCVIILAVIGFVIAIAVNGTKSVDKEIDVFVKGGAKPDDNANAPSADNGALTARPALKYQQPHHSRMMGSMGPMGPMGPHQHRQQQQPPHRSRMMPALAMPVQGAYVYPPTQYQEPIYDAPAPMPQAQLMETQNMPVQDVYLAGVPSSSSIIGDAQMDIMTTEAQGTSIDGFSDNNYLMDPGMMTPSSATDIKGLETFMPYMGGGVGANDDQNNGCVGGPVDPNTGLPLFTTGKLIRSQLLGGHGAGSFLRQVQDPLSGYRKSVGKNLCGVQQARRDLEVRRKQLNAARLEHPDADPILFNTSDFAYN